MSSNSAVVQARALSKIYQIYPSPRARLKQFVLPRLRAAMGLRASRYFSEFHALRNVSFDVGRGETVGIVGRNGSGKSTLLQIICGTLAATSGTVETRGRVAALLELGAGFNPEFTGRENVLLNGAILGMSSSELDARFDEIADFADIGDFIDQPIKTYSSGMVIRLAFATAIHVDPDLLVIDEALSVGDVAFQQKCLNRIRQLQARGVSILLVTHSNNTLIEYCDRAIYLNKGVLAMDGPCRDVVKAYADDLVELEGGRTVVLPAITSPDELELPAVPRPGVGGYAGQEAMSPEIIDAVVVDQRGVVCPTVSCDADIRVILRVRASAPVEAPCFGIQISSVDGIVLWSATTAAMGMALSQFECGIHEFQWNLQAAVGGNRYIVALGVGTIENGEYRRTCRLDYAGHFDVMPELAAGSGWLAPRPRFAMSVEARA